MHLILEILRYLLDIIFILGKCCWSSAVVMPIKYGVTGPQWVKYYDVSIKYNITRHTLYATQWSHTLISNTRQPHFSHQSSYNKPLHKDQEIHTKKHESWLVSLAQSWKIRCVNGTLMPDCLLGHYPIHPPTPPWSWMFNSHRFCSIPIWISSPIHEVNLFQTLTLKIQGQGYVYD